MSKRSVLLQDRLLNGTLSVCRSSTMRETLFEMRLVDGVAGSGPVLPHKRELSVCELGSNPLQFVIATASPTTCPKSASMIASNPGQVVRRHIRNPGAGSLTAHPDAVHTTYSQIFDLIGASARLPLDVSSA